MADATILSDLTETGPSVPESAETSAASVGAAAIQAEENDDLPITIIEPKPGWRFIDFKELWRYRELLFFLTWRDVKVRYKQTVLGAAWAILQPLATTVVFTMFIGRVAGVSTGDIPYPLFAFAGLLPWLLFSSAISSAGQSVVGNQNLVTKVYFPRLIIPMSATGTAVIDFAVALGMLLAMMTWYGAAPGMSILLAPLILLLLCIAALGVGTLLAALTVAYRDFRYVVPFGVQLWMFATPTIYLPTETVVGPRGQALLPINPAYGLIYNFRQTMLGGGVDMYSLVVSSLVSVGLLVLGCFYFRRVERSFADII